MSDPTTPRSTRVLSLRAWGGGFMGGPCRVAGSAHVFGQRSGGVAETTTRKPHIGPLRTVSRRVPGPLHLCTHSLFTGIGGRLCSMGEKWQRHIVLTTLTPASLNNGCEQTKPVRTSLFKVRPTWACRETARPNHRPHSSRAISSACIALIARRKTSRANVQFPAAVSLLPVSPVVAGFPTTAPVRAVVDLCFFRSDMSTLRVRRLCGASGPKAPTEGASEVGGSGIRAYPRGVFLSLSASLRSSFVPVHSVIQLVIPLNLSKEAPLDQMHLPLLCRLDAPSVVSPNLIDACKSYRDAVKLCWELRRIRNMTQQRLAEEAGLYAPHVTCYLRDSNRQRDLPGAAVRAFQWACGNTAISQWLNRGVRLAVVEEMSFLRSCPA